MASFSLEVYSELCCELCGDVIHNHIDCPVCKSRDGYEPTGQYHALDSSDSEINCEVCGTIFELQSGHWYLDPLVKIKENTENETTKQNP